MSAQINVTMSATRHGKPLLFKPFDFSNLIESITYKDKTFLMKDINAVRQHLKCDVNTACQALYVFNGNLSEILQFNGL